METMSKPTLAQTGLKSIKLFREVKGINTFPDANTAQEWPRDLFGAQADRFELWSVNLGLFVSGHGSLDYRLREAVKLEATVRRFVEDLNGSLIEVIEYCSSDPSGVNDEIEDDISATARPFTDFLEVDESSVVEEDDESDIDLLLDSVKDPIDRLFKISTRIRNPSSRLGSSKALRHVQIDQDSGVDLLQVVQDFDYDYVSSMFLQYQKSRSTEEEEIAEPRIETGDEDNLVWEPIRTVLTQNRDDITKGTENFLVRRAALANTRRRQQFAYWKHHRDKLAEHTHMSTFNIEADDDDAPIIAVLEQKVDNRLMSPSPAIIHSVTTATRLNVAHVLLNHDARSTISVSEYAPSAWRPGKEVVDFPPAPKHDMEEKFFECPYCFTLCSTETLSDKAWKAHLIHDLRPYICTYKECRNPQQLYDNRQDWIIHENSHRTVWQCPEHSSHISTLVDDYREHLRINHPDCVSERIQQSQIQAAETTLETAGRCCPICSLHLESARSMHSHVGLHLERFSLFSLPRSIEQAETNSNEADSDKANIAFEGSRDDAFDSDIEFVDDSDPENPFIDENMFEDIYIDERGRPMKQTTVYTQKDETTSVAMKRWKKAIFTVIIRRKADIMLRFLRSTTPNEAQLRENVDATLDDPEENALIIARALKGEEPVKTEALVKCLPRLTHHQLMELRTEYRKIVKTGAEKKGVNVAKHIKSRLQGTGPIAAIAYATALGKWESEAFWISEWSDKHHLSELLIETLLGRSKDEIREIKSAYSRLTKEERNLVGDLEGKMPKGMFKYMVLLALDDENLDGGEGLLDDKLIEQDTDSLKTYRNFQNKKPGERDNSEDVVSIMIRRTNQHLRNVFQLYAERHSMGFIKDLWREQGENFIEKNPVHKAMHYIMCGITNSPKRDAKAIFEALGLDLRSERRTDLLASRLVRCHWDIQYMESVKAEYARQYQGDMQQAVARGTWGDWGRFCEVLCEGSTAIAAHIAEMEAMGFERSQIDQAMRAAFFDSERAIVYLLNGIPVDLQHE